MKSVFGYALLFWLCLSASLVTSGQEITGKVKNLTLESYKSDAVVLIVRDNEALSHADVSGGEFTINQPGDGKPFALLVISSSRAPLIFENLVEVDKSIVAQFDDVARFTLAAVSEPEQRIEMLSTQLEQCQRAKKLMPIDDPALKLLDEFELHLTKQSAISVLIPAYFYPDSPTAASPHWASARSFIAQCKKAKIEVVLILNIANGSGKVDPVSGQQLEVNSDYQKLTHQLAAAQVPWVGYIAGRYGKERPISLEEDFDHWVQNYPGCRGVFLDEMASDAAAAHALKDFCSHVRNRLSQAKIKKPIVIGNPGNVCDEKFAGDGMFNCLCVNENAAENKGFMRPDWAKWDTKTKFGTLTYNIQNQRQMDAAIEDVIRGGGEFLYLTDQARSPGPLWTRLPKDELLTHLGRQLSIWNSQVRKYKGFIPPKVEANRR